MSKFDTLVKEIKETGTQHDGRAVSGGRLDARAEEVEKSRMTEAAAFTEELIAWCNEQWNAREFSPEQRIYSFALAMTNFREQFPAEKGGKNFFDAVGHEAWKYFHANKG